MPSLLRSRKPLLIGPLAVALAMASSRSEATPIFAEDFEIPATSDFFTVSAGNELVTATNTWLVRIGSVDVFNGPARAEVSAFSGSQAVDLSGTPDAGAMIASFPTVSGQEYELTFRYARNDFLVGLAQASVGIGSRFDLLLHETFSHSQPDFDDYLEFRGTFTADDASAGISFASLNPGATGITIDAISISTVPEPAALFLLLAALARFSPRRS